MTLSQAKFVKRCSRLSNPSEKPMREKGDAKESKATIRPVVPGYETSYTV